MVKNEMSTPFLSSQTENTKDSSKFKKASDWLESLLENLVGSHRKTIKCQKFLKGVFIAVFAVTFILYFVAMGYSIVKIRSTREMDVYLLTKIGMICGLSIVCASVQRIEKYEYRRHFTDIGEIPRRSCVAFTILVMVNTIVSSYYGLTDWDIYLLIGLFFTFIFSMASVVLTSQEATKLRFDPCEENHLYALISSVSKDKGSIRIIESSVFKITLQNIGSEIWNSDKFILHRHAGTCRTGKCAKFNLPQFTLSPNQQIDLIPETLKYNGDCIRIPNFHCFGLRDRFDKVKTFTTDREIFSCHTTGGSAICTCNIEKIAELVVTYSKNLWTNVIVS